MKGKKIVTVRGALADRMLDGRVKLLDCQIERIREIHARTGMSYGNISKLLFGGRIAKSYIYYVCNPHKYLEKVRNTSKWQAEQEYDSEHQLAANKKSRQKKKKMKELFNNK